MDEPKAVCFYCKKTPKNCICYEYRMLIKEFGKTTEAWIFVDNIATEPVRGAPVNLWRPRRSSKQYRRAVYVDGFGPVCYTEGGEGFEERVAELKKAIEDDEFFYEDYRNREGFRVPDYDKSIIKKYPFLRKRRHRRKVAA